VSRDTDDTDVERMGPYATSGLQWVGFDDTKTIRQKSEFVRDHGFGGAMIWCISYQKLQFLVYKYL
jgi:GH18 family chitinase